MRQTEIARLLPLIFQRTWQPGSPLAALLDVMETLQAPSEAALDDLDAFFDPRRAPDAFVPLLAGWVDLDWLLWEASEPAAGSAAVMPSGLGFLRELIAAAARLSQWRGTAAGLIRFLETATGVAGFAVEEEVPGPDGRPRPFHLRIHVPAAAAGYEAMIDRIVEAEKPAHVTHELAIGRSG